MNLQQKEQLKDLGVEVGKQVGKTVIRRIGDRMENAKRPFWRKVVRFFRGK